jgi:hypothetical protein
MIIILPNLYHKTAIFNGTTVKKTSNLTSGILSTCHHSSVVQKEHLFQSDISVHQKRLSNIPSPGGVFTELQGRQQFPSKQ